MEFKNEYAFLSNMHKCIIMIGDLMFTSAEQAFVYHKCADFEEREQVLKIDNPYEVKKFGKTVILREDWEDIKLEVMTKIVAAKFMQNKNLAKQLLMIDQPIVEENWWNDTYWGVCRGKGKNHLGLILESLKHILEREIHKNTPYRDLHPDKVLLVDKEIILVDPTHYNSYLAGTAYAN